MQKIDDGNLGGGSDPRGRSNSSAYSAGEVSAMQLLVSGNRSLERKNRLLSYFILGLVATNLVSVSVANNMYNYIPAVEPIGITSDFRVVKIPTLEEPYFDSAYVGNWSERRARDLYSFDFRSVEGEFPNKLLTFMTSRARDSWLLGLQEIGILANTRKNNWFTSASADVALVVNEQVREIGGKAVATWIVEVPVTVRFDAATKDGSGSGTPQRRFLKMFILRAPLHTHSEGLLIDRVEISSKRG